MKEYTLYVQEDDLRDEFRRHRDPFRQNQYPKNRNIQYKNRYLSPQYLGDRNEMTMTILRIFTGHQRYILAQGLWL